MINVLTIYYDIINKIYLPILFYCLKNSLFTPSVQINNLFGKFIYQKVISLFAVQQLFSIITRFVGYNLTLAFAYKSLEFHFLLMARRSIFNVVKTFSTRCRIAIGIVTTSLCKGVYRLYQFRVFKV